MPLDLRIVQGIILSLERAREAGDASVRADRTTASTDDQDCYPRGLQLKLDRKDPKWIALRQVSMNFDWVNLNVRAQYLQVQPTLPTKFRLTQLGYLESVAESLSRDGINCNADVNWH